MKRRKDIIPFYNLRIKALFLCINKEESLGILLEAFDFYENYYFFYLDFFVSNGMLSKL
jgi:hypothetical protein